MSRTKKRKLTGAKSISHNCRNHGTCPWCIRGRMYKHLKRIFKQTDDDNNL